MTVQVLGDTDVRPAATPTIEVYDFQRPTTLGRERMQALTLGLDNFSRQWGTQLTAMTRSVAHVRMESIGVERYGEYIESLPEQTTMVLVQVAEQSGRAVLQFAQDTALGWVGRMLGGTAKLVPPARAFTPIEGTVLGRMLGYLLEDLSYSLDKLIDSPLSVDSIQFSSQTAQAAGAGQFMLVARFVIALGDTVAPTTLAIPLDSLADSEASSRRRFASSQRTTVQLAPVPVSVALRLAPAVVGPSYVLGLAEGDLIRLPHLQSRPLDVVVDDVIIAGAAVGANASRLACVIVSLEEHS